VTHSEIQHPLKGVDWRALASTDFVQFDELAKHEHYHALDIEDCRTKKQVAKVVVRESYVFVVVKSISYNVKLHRHEFDDINLFVKPNSLVTMEEHPGNLVKSILETFGEGREQAHMTIPHLVHAILDNLIDDYLSALDQIGEAISVFEERILKDSTPEQLRHLFHMRKVLVEFRRNAGNMRDVISTIIRVPQVHSGGDLESYFQDVYEHSMRVIEFVETYRDSLNGLFDIYLSTVANRTNEVVKILTVYSILVLPLLIIPGIYGMNVQLPFQQQPFAFALLVYIMALITIALAALLKWRRWF
jgi:magnesium transporter